MHPDLPAFPEFCCPRCHGPLTTEQAAFRCSPCDSVYPVILGIPDFRVEPDPWISLDDDRAKALRLYESTRALSFPASVAAYWAMTPGTPTAMAERFTDYVLEGETRASEWLEANGYDAVSREAPWLEIGCASGDLLAAAAERGVRVVGIDVAMRWLVLARKRSALAAGAQMLVCANGEYLPFAERVFSAVLSVGTLEHCRRAETVLSESARVLRHGGIARMRTTNRFTLLREPHVGVWGVGFVPRRWADAYVRWQSGQRYVHHRPLSPREIRRAMHRAGFHDVTIRAARLLASDRLRMGRAVHAAGPVYERVRDTAGIASPLAWVAPLLDIGGRSA